MGRGGGVDGGYADSCVGWGMGGVAGYALSRLVGQEEVGSGRGNGSCAGKGWGWGWIRDRSGQEGEHGARTYVCTPRSTPPLAVLTHALPPWGIVVVGTVGVHHWWLAGPPQRRHPVEGWVPVRPVTLGVGGR